MSARYPVAASCDAAVSAPLGFGARPSEATRVAGAPVSFVTEPWGATFTTREAASAAHAFALTQGWCALRPVLPEGASPPKPVRPVNRDGVRWPRPAIAVATHWRLSVSYWRLGTAELHAPLPPARRARRDRANARALDGATLGRLAEQPMRAFRPQQPLDVGLFETRLPESPDVIVADDLNASSRSRTGEGMAYD